MRSDTSQRATGPVGSVRPMGEMSGEELVDAIEVASGRHPGKRRAHATGIGVTGTFTATPAAPGLCTAAAMQGGAVPATVRFSNGTGNPATRDDDQDGRGIAVKLRADGDPTWDLIGLSLPQFFVRTPEDFVAFVAARTPDPSTGELDMAKVGTFLEGHPEALGAAGAAITASIPASYAQVRYHGIHSFHWTDPEGTTRAVRYEWAPDAGELAADPAATDRPADHLRRELADRLATGPAAFALWVVIAGDGDAIDDPTERWPDERQRVDVGRLELTALGSTEGEDSLIFDPVNVPPGVECSDDPLLAARSRAYGVSYARRTAGD